MATTATATANSKKMAANNSFHPKNSSTTQQQNQRSTCGCGAASSESGKFSRNEHYVNERSSPVPVPNAAQQQLNDSTKATASPQGNSSAATCNANIASSVNSCSSSNGSLQMSTVADAIDVAATTSRNVESAPPKKSPKDFIFAKFIGEGSFSIVYLAIDVNTKREYAIKVCEKRHILRERKQEYIQREREVMHMMRNVPGFVNLSCTFHDNRSLYFVMTYAKNGDLLQHINKMGSFDVECTRHYAAELVLACEQMHRRNVVHRDLKPENILLDEAMHTLIADFGSAKILTLEDRMAVAVAQQTRVRSAHSNTSSYVDDEEDDDTNDTESDDMDAPSRQPRYHRQRKGSFVGTAQYVSPEVLQSEPVTPAADLWALGCLVYQMISGLPPFRGNHDYMIFKEILACKPDFPQGFDKDAEDLVKQLLKVNPAERLGAKDGNGRYASIRSHPFFVGIDFEAVRQQVPPPIHPYLPGVSKDENFRSQFRVPENLEPGLDDRQVTRLLGAELGTAVTVEQNGVDNLEKKTGAKNFFDLTDAEKIKRLEQQQKSDKWHLFADNEVILKKGFVNKRKGLFARKRMLLLTTGPRLIYIDPVQMVKKGEIPWSPELRVEPKNFKIFFVYTPNRTYYLEDPEGYALDWSDCIDKMRELTYQNQAPLPTSRINTSTRVVASSSSPTTTRVKPMKASSNSN